MKVPIVVKGRPIGEVDVYAQSFHPGIPRDLQLDLDQAILDGRVELEFRIKENT